MIKSKKYDKFVFIRIIKGILACLAIPALIGSFKKGLDNKEIMTRVFTFGVPMHQEFGINLLTLLTHTVMFSFQISRMIESMHINSF